MLYYILLSYWRVVILPLKSGSLSSGESAVVETPCSAYQSKFNVGGIFHGCSARANFSRYREVFHVCRSLAQGTSVLFLFLLKQQTKHIA